ncbi:hypothetical protein LK09_00835 [Microbacterium mangrovi]|uniref:Uncharacterized protein n=1 Tax=Microbacterium mangrovi TaxID=1348253 RepID=A0A0B2A9R6_9MICO|nr:hypothetical protein [Microbacterium mangrovi]KHK99909.1 hypothetical protein LK09_00835 [Microbacterium mangrovi]
MESRPDAIDGAMTGRVDPPTGVSQLAEILAARDLAPVVNTLDDADSPRVNWRWVVGIALGVAVLALAASIILTQNVSPFIRTAGCDLMAGSSSCIVTE